MILDFYEERGHRIFVFVVIGFILFVTIIGFAYEYISIHNMAKKTYEMHGITKNNE